MPRNTASDRLAAEHRNFSPLDVPEGAYWFNARAGVVSSGSSVDSLTSQIGSFVATQTGSNRPTLGTGINGLPTLEFSAASSQELINTTTNLTATNATRYVLIVAKSTVAPDGTMLTFRYNTSGGRAWVLQAAISGGNLNYITDGVSNSVSELTVAAPSLASPFLIEYELTLGATPVIRINRRQRALTGIVNAAGEAGATGFHIGGREGGSGNFWEGSIADIYGAVGIPSALNKRLLVQHFCDLNGLAL